MFYVSKIDLPVLNEMEIRTIVLILCGNRARYRVAYTWPGDLGRFFKLDLTVYKI